MEYVYVPNWLLVVELVSAGPVLLLWFAWVWPAVVSELRRDLAHQRRAAWVLAAATFVAAVLRLTASPTVLYGLGQAAPHISKLFHPFGADAHWHAHAGIGGYAFFYALSLLAGKRLATVWIANALLGACCVPAMYLFVRRIADREAALCAAWLLAVYVPQIRVDASEQLVTLSVLASLFTYVLWLDAYEREDKRRWNAAGAALAACLCFRPASIWLGAFAVLLPAWLAVGRKRLPYKGIARAGLVALPLSAPRLVVGATAIVQSGRDLTGGQLRFAWPVVTSWRDVFLDSRYSSPVYALVVVTGLVVLAYRRRLRLLAFMLVAIVLTVLLYYNEWTLDENDALRFQAVSWPLLIALAGIGAGAATRLFADTRLRAGISVAIVAAAGAWLLVGKRLLWTPLASDTDLEFFASNLDKVPRRCTLFLQGRLKPGHKPTFDPRWLLTGRQVRRFPRGFDGAGNACRVAYVGVDCYTYAVDDVYDDRKLRMYYRRTDRRPLFTFIDGYKAKFDRKPPPRLRPECALLRQRYRLEPIVETSIRERRGGSRFWRPGGPLKIGFYFLRPRSPAPN